MSVRARKQFSRRQNGAGLAGLFEPDLFPSDNSHLEIKPSHLEIKSRRLGRELHGRWFVRQVPIHFSGRARELSSIRVKIGFGRLQGRVSKDVADDVQGDTCVREPRGAGVSEVVSS